MHILISSSRIMILGGFEINESHWLTLNSASLVLGTNRLCLGPVFQFTLEIC